MKEYILIATSPSLLGNWGVVMLGNSTYWNLFIEVRSENIGVDVKLGYTG